jgi:hypothetical protein
LCVSAEYTAKCALFDDRKDIVEANRISRCHNAFASARAREKQFLNYVVVL